MSHWFTRKINGEEDWLTAITADTGWVQTDLGNATARSVGLEQAPVAIDESCSGIFKLIEGTTKESHGGKKIRYDGAQTGW